MRNRGQARFRLVPYVAPQASDVDHSAAYGCECFEYASFQAIRAVINCFAPVLGMVTIVHVRRNSRRRRSPYWDRRAPTLVLSHCAEFAARLRDAVVGATAFVAGNCADVHPMTVHCTTPAVNAYLRVARRCNCV